MKINEFKAKPKKKMNEVSAGWAALKGMFTGNDDAHQQLTQDIFINDFVNDALISIKNGISGGIIDPSNYITTKKPEAQTGNFAQSGITKGGATTQPPKPSSGPIAGAGTNFTKGPSPKLNANLTGKDRSLQKYLITWYNGWMKNINWQEEEDHVKSLIKNVADTYSRDKGKAALTRLAQASFSIAQANGGVPFGAENAVAKAGGRGAGSEKRTPDQIKADIEDLRKRDPTTSNELITDLIKTYAGSKPR